MKGLDLSGCRGEGGGVFIFVCWMGRDWLNLRCLGDRYRGGWG